MKGTAVAMMVKSNEFIKFGTKRVSMIVHLYLRLFLASSAQISHFDTFEVAETSLVDVTVAFARSLSSWEEKMYDKSCFDQERELIHLAMRGISSGRLGFSRRAAGCPISGRPKCVVASIWCSQSSFVFFAIFEIYFASQMCEWIAPLHWLLCPDRITLPVDYNFITSPTPH